MPLSKNMTMLEIRVAKCKGRDTCRSEAEIEQYLKQHKLMVWNLFGVIDFDNITEPIQQQKFTTYWDTILSSASSQQAAPLHIVQSFRRSKFSQKDSWLNFLEPGEDTTLLQPV